MKVALVSCGKTKLPRLSKARDLYQGDLFRKSLKYAQKLDADKIFILSAKYGLLDLDAEIEPYDQSLIGARVAELREWSARVLESLAARTDLERDHFVVLAGIPYRRFLLPHLSSFDVPLEGLSQGAQKQQLARLLAND
jgi:hypothetical protein